MLPLWCMAFAAQHQEIDFLAFEESNNEIESGQFSFKSLISFTDSQHWNFLSDENIPSSENSENKNSDEPEEKEEKNENHEDQDHESLSCGRLITTFREGLNTFKVTCIDTSILTTPLYILFHSWKIYLI